MEQKNTLKLKDIINHISKDATIELNGVEVYPEENEEYLEYEIEWIRPTLSCNMYGEYDTELLVSIKL